MKDFLGPRLLLAAGVLPGLFCQLLAEEHPRAREVVDAAIEAMGGERYLQVENHHSTGRYFIFDKNGRTRGFARFFDWTTYEPVKWRFQLGEDKRRQVQVYNLELEKGWKLEGKRSVEEIPESDVREFARRARSDMDLLLRKRLDEEGMHLFYYGSDEIAGSGEWEAVEFLDATNTAVVIFFDRKTHLPAKWETQVTNRMGVRLKQEVEFHNWHTIQGVHTPLRYDSFVEGRKSTQRFLETIRFNIDIPAHYFLEPKPEEE